MVKITNTHTNSPSEGFMKPIIDFFEGRGFDFKKDLTPSIDLLSEDENLRIKLKNAFFFYEGPNQNNTSFYLAAAKLELDELNSLRKLIWNENKADLLFSFSAVGLFQSVQLNYAKASPKVTAEQIKMDTFSLTEKDQKILKKIHKSKFDSGAFWLDYLHFLEKVRLGKSIDAELIETLIGLKQILNNEIKDEEVVQSLIDRTLYIKYLEDNHIINSYFYNYYFGSSEISYKTLLEERNPANLNKLFKVIDEIFNNYLFDNPKIAKEYLSHKVCDLLRRSLTDNLQSQQFRLYDFNFRIIPIEFISYIYEIFLSNKAKKGGIYYTPQKLAQLIVDDVIPKGNVGRILDPACGSGMFLIVAFQKLLENTDKNKQGSVANQIKHRLKLLSENIFGIEKENTARRFTIFSLSLQIFRDISAHKIKDYIAEQLKLNGKVEIFKNHSFSQNICWANTLSVANPPFQNLVFDYIIGNPPFFKITKQYPEEINFVNKYHSPNGKAREIIGNHQISQCFLLKIKDWSHANTRFGFVSNNSNFYNDKSLNFQSFFYRCYKIEKIYELSKVKRILFENANESVNALIFTNQLESENIISYYDVELGLFSEKPFQLLIINEDTVQEIKQKDLIRKPTLLRDFLIGNSSDHELLDKLRNLDKLESHLRNLTGTRGKVSNGLQFFGESQRLKEFNLSTKDWSELSVNEQNKYKESFKAKYTQNHKSSKFPYPLIQPGNISNFRLKKLDTFLSGDVSNFERGRNPVIYQSPKILVNRVGINIAAIFSDDMCYYDTDIYSIFPKQIEMSYLLTAIINSDLVTYFINTLYTKRVGGSFPKIGSEAILNIPIPFFLDQSLTSEISRISKILSDTEDSHKVQLTHKLNDLIYELYQLSFLDKQRIRDYFKLKGNVSTTELAVYKQALHDTIGVYFKNAVEIEIFRERFDLVVAKISIGNKQSPSAKKVAQFTLSEILNHNPHGNFWASQEKIFGKNFAYIIKKSTNLNWTITKAFEDGQEILKRKK